MRPAATPVDFLKTKTPLLALQIVIKKGKLQRIHIMVCTYSEPVETVEMCVRKIINSTTPCYAEKLIYIGDDGASVPKYKEIADGKLAFVKKMHEEGVTLAIVNCVANLIHTATWNCGSTRMCCIQVPGYV